MAHRARLGERHETGNVLHTHVPAVPDRFEDRPLEPPEHAARLLLAERQEALACRDLTRKPLMEPGCYGGRGIEAKRA